MIRRSTWVLLAIFATLAASALYWQRTAKPSTAEPTATSRPALFDFDAGSINRVQLSNSSLTLVINKQADERWVLEGDQLHTLDSGEVTNRLAQLVAVRALNVIDVIPQDTLTGLDNPMMKISLVLKNGRTIQVDVGASTVTGSGYYSRIDGGTLYVVSKSVMDSILAMLEAPPLETPQADAAQSPDFTGTPTP